MNQIKVKTIKQYQARYYVTFGYNGAQLGRDESTIEIDTIRNAKGRAFYDCFIPDINKFRTLPTPRFENCTFEIINSSFYNPEPESKYRVYTIGVIVTYQIEK